MTFLLLNLLLAGVWVLLTRGGLRDFAFGFAIGFGALALSRWFIGSRAYVRGMLGALKLLVVFVNELVLANLRLARDVLRPRARFSPAIVRIDAEDLSPAETTLLAILISLTPGSLTVDSDAEGRTLFVHTLYASDAEEARRDVQRFATLIRMASGKAPEGEGVS